MDEYFFHIHYVQSLTPVSTCHQVLVIPLELF